MSDLFQSEFDPVLQQAPLNLLPISNFLGGLNIASGDTLLADNESGDMCNIDPQRAGGFCRRAPVRLHTREDLPAQICNIVQWQDEDGNAILFIMLEDGTVWATPGGAPANATPVLQPWTTPGNGDCQSIEIGFNQYFYNTQGDAVCVEDGTNPTTVPWQTIDAAPAFNTDCSGELIAVGCDENGNPNLTDEVDFVFGFPQAECMAVHADFAWAANVIDPVTGDRECNRVYRSFPLTGAASTGQVWGSQNYIDIDPGNGDCITNLLSCGPNLYVFKHNSVYIIQGWDDPTAGNLVSVQICGDAGTPSCKTAVCCECLVYFWDERRGLFRINGTQLEYMFEKLEPLIRKGCIRPDCEPAIGCCNGRIHVSVPEAPVTPEDEEAVEELPDCANTTTYVLTPETETWTKYTYGIDCYLAWCPRGEKARCLAASSVGGNFSVVEIERPGYENYGLDVFSVAAGGTGIESFWRSKWFDGGNPFSTKNWCPPHVLAQAAPPQRTDFEPPRNFDLDFTYLCDWCLDEAIGGGSVSYFENIDGDEPEPVLEVVIAGSDPTPVCPPDVVVSDRTCPVTNNKKEKKCGPDVTSKSCSMQLVITGPENKPWCVCAILLGWSEEVFRC